MTIGDNGVGGNTNQRRTGRRREEASRQTWWASLAGGRGQKAIQFGLVDRAGKRLESSAGRINLDCRSN